MKRNPVIPFAIIAVAGILVMIVVSAVGSNQQQAIQNAENGEEQQQETANAGPEQLYQNKCSNCHGGDLSGGVGPSLQEVGSRYSAEEIQEIIKNGRGQMPSGLYSGDKAAKVAEWLAQKK